MLLPCAHLHRLSEHRSTGGTEAQAPVANQNVVNSTKPYKEGPMSRTNTASRPEGDNSIYAQADGKVVPVVTRAGKQNTFDTAGMSLGDFLQKRGRRLRISSPTT